MRKSRITTYNPLLTAAENGELNGVSASAIRHYIKVNDIDQGALRKRHIYNIVHNYLSQHPAAKVAEISGAVGIPQSTVRRYLKLDAPPKPKENKIAKVNTAEDMTFISVSDNQTKILKSIVAFHLPGDETFECDLTAWKCGFYRDGLQRPKYLYDKHPQMEGVMPLDRVDDLAFKSVVVDLPVGVYKSDGRKELNVATEFASMEELHQENIKMLRLARAIMRPSGILVYKTMDFTFKGATQWISDFVIQKARENGFVLIDKYIYIDPKHTKLKGRRSHLSASVPAHAYFLVFRMTPSTNLNDCI